MTIDERAALPPGPEYKYGGYHVRVEEVSGSTTQWRVVDDESYYGVIAAAEPVKDEPGVHFATYFPGEEDIPPTKIVPLWTSAVEFLLDAHEKD